MMETTELLEALGVVLTVMGVLTVFILGVLVAGVAMIFQEKKRGRGDSWNPSVCKKEASE